MFGSNNDTGLYALFIVIVGIIGVGALFDAITKIKNFFTKPKESPEPITEDTVKLLITQSCQCMTDSCAAKSKACRREVDIKLEELDKTKANKEWVEDIQRLQEATSKTIQEMAIGQARQDGKLDVIIEKFNSIEKNMKKGEYHEQ